MNLDKITLQFTSEEIESIHYILELGVRSFDKRPLKVARDWRDTAESIRKKLPIRLRF